MWHILQHHEGDDFVIATGETHSVKEFVELAFGHAGIQLDWEGEGVDEKGIDRKTGKEIVAIDPWYFRPTEVDLLIGDGAKAKKLLNWEPKVKFEELVRIMMEHELKKL